MKNLISVCKKTHSVLRKRQGQGARSPKKRNVLCVHEHFLDERNAEIGVFLETLIKIFVVGLLFLGSYPAVLAQDISFQQELNEGIIRIAGQDQLADTLNLWGDVKATGKYLVPRKTSLTDLISYARGPIGLTNTETWSKVKLDIYISRYNPQQEHYQNQSFSLKLNEPLPQEMRNYPLKNGDLITLKAKRKPTFRDYFTIIAPILSLGLTAFIAVDRLNE